jgi:hypothetical protein
VAPEAARAAFELTEVAPPLLNDLTVADTQPPSDIECVLSSTTASFPVN